MKYSVVLRLGLLGMMLTSCGSENDQNNAALKDPSDTHSPSEAITDSTRIINDSVIVPDTRAGSGDSISHNR